MRIANSVKWFTPTLIVASLLMVLPPAYAETLIRDAECEFIKNAGFFDITFRIVDTETYDEDKARGYEIIGPDGEVLARSDLGPGTRIPESGISISFGNANSNKEGQYTINAYTNDAFTNPFEGEKGSATVTCELPPLTDIFKNQGECVKYVTSHKSSPVTKQGCKNAFA